VAFVYHLLICFWGVVVQLQSAVGHHARVRVHVVACISLVCLSSRAKVSVVQTTEEF